MKKFEPLLPILIKTSVEAIKADQESGTASLGAFAELIETHPKFIKTVFNDYLMIITEIISTKGLTESLRAAAFGNLEVLARTNAALVRKAEIFKTTTIPNVLMAMTEVEDVPLSEWNEDLSNQVISKGDVSSAADDCLFKICPHIGKDFLKNPLF